MYTITPKDEMCVAEVSWKYRNVPLRPRASVWNVNISASWNQSSIVASLSFALQQSIIWYLIFMRWLMSNHLRYICSKPVKMPNAAVSERYMVDSPGSVGNHRFICSSICTYKSDRMAHAKSFDMDFRFCLYLTHIRYVEAELKLHACRMSPHPSQAVSSAQRVASGISSSLIVGGREKTSEYNRSKAGVRLARCGMHTGKSVPCPLSVGHLPRLELPSWQWSCPGDMETYLVSQSDSNTQLDPGTAVVWVLPDDHDDQCLDETDVTLSQSDSAVDDLVQV